MPFQCVANIIILHSYICSPNIQNYDLFAFLYGLIWLGICYSDTPGLFLPYNSDRKLAVSPDRDMNIIYIAKSLQVYCMWI